MRKCSLGDTQYCARGWLLIVKFGVWLQLVNNGAKNVIPTLRSTFGGSLFNTLYCWSKSQSSLKSSFWGLKADSSQVSHLEL